MCQKSNEPFSVCPNISHVLSVPMNALSRPQLHFALAIGILDTMIDRLRPSVALVIVVVFLLGTSFADFWHKHFFAANYGSPQQLQSHDYGTREIHKTLDVRFHCVTGCRTLTTSLSHTPSLVTPSLVVHQVCCFDSQSDYALGFQLTGSKRGPPCFIA